MLIFTFLATFCFLGWASSKICPYDRQSTRHSFCLKPNLFCDIRHAGVKKEEIQQILKIHNWYRSDVALGKENRAHEGTLPQVSDMMQMVWDHDLAGIAQKWADNCIYKHDCSDCRSVDDYPVGQNIAYQDWLCTDQRCTDTITEEDLKPEWDKVLEDFYMEVKDFDKKELQNYQQNPVYVVGHFTQIIWARTWRVGCGFTVFKKGFNYRRFYVCNYGPTGNVREASIYKAGPPCSACPVNSCCGKSCKGAMDYPGLCKLNDPNSAPVYKMNLTGLFFYCDSQRATKDCDAKVEGVNKWKYKSNHYGNYTSIVLSGGESSALIFKRQLSPSEIDFCVRIMFRKGPMKAGQPDGSHWKAEFNPPGYLPVNIDLNLTSNVFVPFNLDLHWKAETKFTLRFSVASNARPQVLDIKEIVAYNGKCNSRKF